MGGAGGEGRMGKGKRWQTHGKAFTVLRRCEKLARFSENGRTVPLWVLLREYFRASSPSVHFLLLGSLALLHAASVCGTVLLVAE